MSPLPSIGAQRQPFCQGDKERPAGAQGRRVGASANRPYRRARLPSASEGGFRSASGPTTKASPLYSEKASRPKKDGRLLVPCSPARERYTFLRSPNGGNSQTSADARWNTGRRLTRNRPDDR